MTAPLASPRLDDVASQRFVGFSKARPARLCGLRGIPDDSPADQPTARQEPSQPRCRIEARGGSTRATSAAVDRAPVPSLGRADRVGCSQVGRRCTWDAQTKRCLPLPNAGTATTRELSGLRCGRAPDAPGRPALTPALPCKATTALPSAGGLDRRAFIDPTVSAGATATRATATSRCRDNSPASASIA